MQHLALLPQAGAGDEHRADHGQQSRSFGKQFQHPRIEGRDGDRDELETKGLECAPAAGNRLGIRPIG
jgi:hypothetical protein